MLTKKKPYSNLQTTKDIFFEVVTNCGRPKFPEEEIAPYFREMIESCWAQNPNERPNFEDIVFALKNDERFVSDVDKNKFFEYVEMIEKSNEIQQKINENISLKIIENEK